MHFRFELVNMLNVAAADHVAVSFAQIIFCLFVVWHERRMYWGVWETVFKMAEVLLSEAEKTFILHGVEVSYE
jgi:hypothetical protein